MSKKAAIIAISIGFAVPVAANEQIARKAGVEPGTYTLSEMVQLMSTNNDSDHKRRLELIDKQRAAFAEAVRTATPEVTRANH